MLFHSGSKVSMAFIDAFGHLHDQDNLETGKFWISLSSTSKLHFQANGSTIMTMHRKLRQLDKNDIFLAQFSKNVTSQCGEDGILEKLFSCLNLVDPVCVDIGAWDGKHLSNTFSLLKDGWWRGLLVEANSERCSEAKALYANNPKVVCIESFVHTDGPSSLLSTMQAQNIPPCFDFLCIDVDGADYHLWKSISNVYTPSVVCIEFNPSIPHDVYFVQPCNTAIHQGSSLSALQELGRELGYSIVAVTAFNGIFLRNDLMPRLQSLEPGARFPQDLDLIHQPQMTTAMFQTYDGELKYCGVKKLLWHNLALNPQTLQVLPAKNRKYPFGPAAQTNEQVIITEESILASGEERVKFLLQSFTQLPAARSAILRRLEQLIFQAHEVSTTKLTELCQNVTAHCQCHRGDDLAHDQIVLLLPNTLQLHLSQLTTSIPEELKLVIQNVARYCTTAKCCTATYFLLEETLRRTSTEDTLRRELAKLLLVSRKCLQASYLGESSSSVAIKEEDISKLLSTIDEHSKKSSSSYANLIDKFALISGTIALLSTCAFLLRSRKN